MKAELQLPSFEVATEWLNQRLTARQTRGHPTLVHFWSVSSETSKINLAQVAELRDQRKREGLRVVAVHVPQSEAEKNSRTVAAAAERLNLTEPCALDNEHKLTRAFLNGNDDLPAYILFGFDGEFRGSANSAAGMESIEDQ